MIENLNLINRDRLDDILTQLAFECSDIRDEHHLETCRKCPYKEACDALNRIEVALIIDKNKKE